MKTPSKQPTLNKRVLEHVIAGVTTAAPINAAIVFITSALVSNPLVITIVTTVLATAVSAIRTFLVLRAQDDRAERIAAST